MVGKEIERGGNNEERSACLRVLGLSFLALVFDGLD